MIYLLVAIGAIFSIITTAFLKSITSKTKNKEIKRAIIVIISLIAFVFVCIFILEQKSYQ
jgi:RsiW-degrading membrane proteinase PrsW (M82 family)